jgi:hypothetical protein
MNSKGVTKEYNGNRYRHKAASSLPLAGMMMITFLASHFNIILIDYKNIPMAMIFLSPFFRYFMQSPNMWSPMNVNKILLLIFSCFLSTTGHSATAHFFDSPSNVKNGRHNKWTKTETNQLINLVIRSSICNWDEIAKNIPGRTPKQCKRRWLKIQTKFQIHAQQLLLQPPVQRLHPDQSFSLLTFTQRNSQNSQQQDSAQLPASPPPQTQISSDSNADDNNKEYLSDSSIVPSDDLNYFDTPFDEPPFQW